MTTNKHPLFDAIDEMAKSACYVSDDDDSKALLDAELDLCIQQLQEIKNKQTSENE